MEFLLPPGRRLVYTSRDIGEVIMPFGIAMGKKNNNKNQKQTNKKQGSEYMVISFITYFLDYRQAQSRQE